MPSPQIYDNSPIPLNAVIPKDDKYQFPEAPAEAESKEMETPLPPAARGPTTPKSRNAEAEQIRSAVHYDLAVCHAIGRLEAMVNAKEEVALTSGLPIHRHFLITLFTLV